LEKIKLFEGIHLCEGCYLLRMRSYQNLERSNLQKWRRRLARGGGLDHQNPVTRRLPIILLTGHRV
jgi:hypothetical protein